MTAIHQFLATLEPGATGNHALLVQRALRDAGFESELFAEFTAPSWAGRARPHVDYGLEFSAHADDVLVYQLATGSNVADFLLGRNERLIVNYHNFTPPEYFARWEPAVVHGIEWGRRQRAQLASRTTLGIAVSRFNERDLNDDGYRRTTVCPVLIDPNEFMRVPDSDRRNALVDAGRDGGADLLFVGRVAPNKCQHDLVKVLAAYRSAFDPAARLHIVGGSSADRYVEAIGSFADALGLADAVDITGSVTGEELAAYFDVADVLVSMSEHEGFCVPLIEAMHQGVPVVAYGTAAIPETLGNAGVVLETKSPERAAAAIHKVISDAALRERLVAAGRDRARAFDVEVVGNGFVDAVRSVVEPVRS